MITIYEITELMDSFGGQENPGNPSPSAASAPDRPICKAEKTGVVPGEEPRLFRDTCIRCM
jgi:hypothetical protein